MARLTTFSKLIITILIVGIVALLGKCALDSPQVQDIINKQTDKEKSAQVESTGNDRSSSSSSSNTSSSSGDDVIKIGVVTWGGYAGGQYFNEGFDANERSRFYRDYGFKVQFEILDDFAYKAKERNITIKLVSERGIVENPPSYIEFFKLRPQTA